MAVTAGALRELHRIHRQLSDLRERLERGPKQIRAREANVKHLEGELEEAKQETTAARMTADRKQVELKGGEQKIVDLQAKLNSCSSNKEYHALLDQIAAAEMANSVLADEILEGLELIDELQTKSGEAKKKLDAGSGELEKIKRQVTEAVDSIRADITRLEAELKEAEGALPPEFRVAYDRVVKSKGEHALATVEEDCCSGCYQRITPNEQNELYLSRAVFCKSCGRLLYLPEGHSPLPRN